MRQKDLYTLGIDIGSTTVKIAVLNDHNEILFSDYERHYANIQETLSDLLGRALYTVGSVKVSPMITGSGGLTLAKHLGVPFVQEVIAVSSALQDYAPQTDVAIELGGEDAKIIYFEGKNVEQRMNGICAGGTGSFIDQRHKRRLICLYFSGSCQPDDQRTRLRQAYPWSCCCSRRTIAFSFRTSGSICPYAEP